jgi:hypothetical protein
MQADFKDKTEVTEPGEAKFWKSHRTRTIPPPGVQAVKLTTIGISIGITDHNCRQKIIAQQWIEYLNQWRRKFKK